MECSRDRILLGRDSNSHLGALGSIVIFMIESAKELAISYSFSSYTSSVIVLSSYMYVDGQLTIPRPWASIAGLGSCETMFRSSLATAIGNDGEVGHWGDW